ncbi:MAG: VOC family protein [Acidimicrobiia bacterium]
MFSWTDLGVPDGGAAKAFYGELFGWQFKDLPGRGDLPYSMAMVGSHDVAAVYQQGPQQAGTPPAWMSYINVEDADKVATRASELGGSVVAEPFEAEGAGRLAVISDPTGAVVSLWQPVQHEGAGIFNVHGAMTWNELATRDGETAKSFFGDLLGWTFHTTETPRLVYHEIRVDGRSNGGILEMDERWSPEAPARWMTYFAVDDCDETTEKVVELEGTVAVPPTDIPAGRYAIVKDQQGAAFTIFAFPEGQGGTQPV